MLELDEAHQMNYGWLDPFGQRYIGSRKPFGDATLMELFGFSRSCLDLHVEVKRCGRLELHVEVERLHVEVKRCGQLDFMER